MVKELLDLENCFEKDIMSFEDQMSHIELIKHIQSIDELKGYKLQYLLNFTIEKSQYELINLTNTSNSNSNSNDNEHYKLATITNIKSFQFEERKHSNKAYFTALNTLIIIANKNNKYYIKRQNNLDKKNTSKKNIKS